MRDVGHRRWRSGRATLSPLGCYKNTYRAKRDRERRERKRESEREKKSREIERGRERERKRKVEKRES